MKLEKCKQKIREVGFLEIVIGLDRIKMKEQKVKGVLEWLTSKCVKDVQKFLGLANYYCQFIKDFVSIARLLYDMIKRDQKQDWSERQKEAFRELKKRFTKEPVLAILDLNKKNENRSRYIGLCYEMFYLWYYKLHSACVSTTSGPIFTN